MKTNNLPNKKAKSEETKTGEPKGGTFMSGALQTLTSSLISSKLVVENVRFLL